MNERIKKLAEQAGINIDSFQFSGTPIKHIVDEPSLEKFAELIVEDMHKKVIASILITDVVMDANGQVPTSEDYIRAINNDFGVEE